MIESKSSPKKYGHPGFQTHETEMLEKEAVIAISMAERWGTVSAEPDGEDTSGRAKLKLMPVEKIVSRAFETAKLLMKHARENNLIHKCPTIEEMEKDQKKYQDEEKD